jgi:hypothetical protein
MTINVPFHFVQYSFYYCVLVVTHVFKSEDINIVLTMHIPIVRDSARIFRQLVTFAEQYFFLIMNKQKYNKFNLIIRYFALLSLLTSHGDRKARKNFPEWEHTPKISHQLINTINIKLLKVRVLTTAVPHKIATIFI